MTQTREPIRIILLNVHGLVKGSGLEIGRDADNGGQTKYVFEVAEYLSKNPRVKHVHIFTRLIDDKQVSSEYAVPLETLNPKLDIRRIPFGGKKYRLKEKLWDFLDDFVSESIKHINKHDIFPDWIHSHYGDAGYAAVELSRILNVPFAHTGHSLGIHKRTKMLGIGMKEAEAEKKFRFKKRIAAEEATLSLAQFIVTSTQQEIASYQEYENFLSAQYHSIPPGIDTEKFFPYYQEKVSEEFGPEELQRKYWVSEYIEKFLINPHKPVIMALSRPDRRKNLHTLIDIYGQDPELQSIANLVIFAGIRKDINQMPPSEKAVLTNILLQMDKYDLYGKLAIPKKHDVENEVDTIYRYCAEKRGAFVNLTLYENFGLTTIEAGASGLPVVVTRNGGPSEIIPVCKNGILVDPNKPKEIKRALTLILTNENKWKEFSNNGILNVQKEYSWESHVDRYLQLVDEHLELIENSPQDEERPALRLLETDKKMLATDIDGTLIAPKHQNPGLEDLAENLKNRDKGTLFAFATGRNIDLATEVIDQYNIPMPDIIISSVGSEIHYCGSELIIDKGWSNFLRWRWKKDALIDKLSEVPWLELQQPEAQREFKVSYNYRDDRFDPEEIKKALSKQWHQVNVITSHGKYLDILPKRASKGQAIMFICRKWSIPLDLVYAAGDSGNDLEMFRGAIKGIVVGNKSAELNTVTPEKNIYLADDYAAAGINEGLSHYGFEF